MATIPDQLPVIMKDFSKAVLKEQPDDILAFAAAYGPLCRHQYYIYAYYIIFIDV